MQLKCCGVESFNDYPRYGMAIPVSCYMAGHTYLNEKVRVLRWLTFGPFYSSLLRFQGCALALRQFLELRAAVVGFLCFFNGLVRLATFRQS